jgi:glycosyltransferase involved in cell wall biosynthesis
MGMKLSIVIPVLNSAEVVRRQLLHFSRIDMPDTELIIVDDGSDPPLESLVLETLRAVGSEMRLKIHATNDKRPWTWALARNAGARIATGEYLLMFDVDHIVPGPAIRFLREHTYQKVQFIREFGVLDENGKLTQDRQVLADYGLPLDKGLSLGPLPNNFAIRRELFWELGGYREDLVERPYPQGEDRHWRSVWRTYEKAHGGEGSCVCPQRPRIYMFPNGKFIGDVDADPKGLFHGLTRKTRRNFWFKQQREREQRAS